MWRPTSNFCRARVLSRCCLSVLMATVMAPLTPKWVMRFRVLLPEPPQPTMRIRGSGTLRPERSSSMSAVLDSRIVASRIWETMSERVDSFAMLTPAPSTCSGPIPTPEAASLLLPILSTPVRPTRTPQLRDAHVNAGPRSLSLLQASTLKYRGRVASLPHLAQLVEHPTVVVHTHTSQQTSGCPRFKSGSGDHRSTTPFEVDVEVASDRSRISLV